MGNCVRTQAEDIVQHAKPQSYEVHEEVDNDGLFTSYGSHLSPLTVYSYPTLVEATKDFNRSHFIGEGLFGMVFRASIPEPRTGSTLDCAIKRMNLDGVHGLDEWVSEVTNLSRLKHPNLVKLYGYCSHGEEAILVYELVKKGSLEKYLYGREDGVPSLSLDIRIEIVYKISKAILFLHQNNVIHRDIEARNVLLLDNWEVKLADFGLTKALGADVTHVTTRVMGTQGYLDPHYRDTGHVTYASDIYSFGVLLLELITGRPAATPDVEGSELLVNWARKIFDESNDRLEVEQLIDPEIIDQVKSTSDRDRVKKLASIAKYCIQDELDARPLAQDLVDTIHYVLRPRRC